VQKFSSEKINKWNSINGKFNTRNIEIKIDKCFLHEKNNRNFFLSIIWLGGFYLNFGWIFDHGTKKIQQKPLM
jgi:hypothetical protein